MWLHFHWKEIVELQIIIQSVADIKALRRHWVAAKEVAQRKKQSEPPEKPSRPQRVKAIVPKAATVAPSKKKRKKRKANAAPAVAASPVKPAKPARTAAGRAQEVRQLGAAEMKAAEEEEEDTDSDEEDEKFEIFVAKDHVKFVKVSAPKGWAEQRRKTVAIKFGRSTMNAVCITYVHEEQQQDEAVPADD